MDAHILTPEEVAEWRERDSLLSLREQDFGASVYTDDAGAVIWWTDYVANEWAEWYPDLGTALARLAALVRADRISKMAEMFEGLEGYGYFRDTEPEQFMRWSEQFFERTITGTINPGTKKAQ